MKNICQIAGCLWLAGILVFTANAETQLVARVKTDRVNLRAKPDQQSETVGQASTGALLPVRSAESNWVAIVPPPEIDFWVHKEFVVDDTVTVNKLNARAGAGINYTIIGAFMRGDRVERRGSFSEWLKVGAPSDATLWVSRDLVDLMDPSAPVPAPEAALPSAPPGEVAPEIALTPEPPPPFIPPGSWLPPPPPPGLSSLPTRQEPVPDALDQQPAPPPDLALIPLAGQGRRVQREGMLKRAPLLVFHAPGTHRLVKRDGNSLITTAYLRGNTEQLNSLLDQYLLVHGREYWVEKVKAPVIVIESIEKRAFY